MSTPTRTRSRTAQGRRPRKIATPPQAAATCPDAYTCRLRTLAPEARCFFEQTLAEFQAKKARDVFRLHHTDPNTQPAAAADAHGTPFGTAPAPDTGTAANRGKAAESGDRNATPATNHQADSFTVWFAAQATVGAQLARSVPPSYRRRVWHADENLINFGRVEDIYPSQFADDLGGFIVALWFHDPVKFLDAMYELLMKASDEANDLTGDAAELFALIATGYRRGGRTLDLMAKACDIVLQDLDATQDRKAAKA